MNKLGLIISIFYIHLNALTIESIDDRKKEDPTVNMMSDDKKIIYIPFNKPTVAPMHKRIVSPMDKSVLIPMNNKQK